MDSTVEILEKSKERVGRVKLGFGGMRLGFLRWWSLIRAWNFSDIRVSAGDKSTVGVIDSFSSKSASSKVEEEEEEA